MDMRGLRNFIADIRAATNNREQEVRRVQEEMSKIRAKFKNSHVLSAYDRKKYVCKLLFIFMLGYEVDFGHMEAVQLLSGQSQTEKIIGYLASAVLLHEGHQLVTLTTHTITTDLAKGDELRKCLALTAVANMANRDFADATAPHVQAAVTSHRLPVLCTKKAMLALLRLHRKFPDTVDIPAVAPAVVQHVASAHYGLATCALGLVQGLLSDPEALEPLRGAQGACVRLLERIILDRTTPNEYVHYGVPCPWLQVKAIRVLQYFPPPEGHDAEVTANILGRIVQATVKVIHETQQVSAKRGAIANRCNCMVAVLAEVISVAIQWDSDPTLLAGCREALGLLITDKRDPNMRCLGLTLLSRLSFCQASGDSFGAEVAKFQSVIVSALHDPDSSIRKRALDLLYAMANRETAEQVVGELLDYLPTAAPDFREDLVLMIAILAEKFCGELSWYVNVLISVMEEAGDVVTEDIWHRLCHVVVNAPAVQKHAVDAAFRALVRSTGDNDVLLQVVAFLLGEFGYAIALVSGSEPADQLAHLQAKSQRASLAARAMVLTTYGKLYNLYDTPAVRERIKKLLLHARSSMDAELQQRAAEYYALVSHASDAVLQAVFEPLPQFALDETAIVRQLQDRHKGEDRNLWTEKRTARDDQQLKESAVLTAAKTTEAPATTTTGAAPERPKHVDPSDPAPAAAVTSAAASPDEPAPVLKDRGLSDLLGGIGTAASPPPAPAAPAAPSAPAAAGNVLDSVFGNVSPAPPLATSATPATTATAAPSPAVGDTSLRFAAGGALEGTVAEGQCLRVTVKAEFRGADARLTLTVTNAHPTETLSHFAPRVADTPASLMLQMRPAATTEIAPGQTAVVELAARCLAPFTQKAQLLLSGQFVTSQAALNVILPLVATRFVEPYKIDSAEKLQALWGNTQSTRSGPAGAPAPLAVPLGPQALQLASEGVVAVERLLFQQLRLFTMRPAEDGRVLAVGAHAAMPGDSVQYTPCLLSAHVTGGGGGGAMDPFAAPVPAAAAGPAVATIDARAPNAVLEAELLSRAEALLRQ